jgi:hypothetical protein
LADRDAARRHGLTAETVIDGLGHSEDYRGFETAIIADYDAEAAVERELVFLEGADPPRGVLGNVGGFVVDGVIAIGHAPHHDDADGTDQFVGQAMIVFL